MPNSPLTATEAGALASEAYVFGFATRLVRFDCSADRRDRDRRAPRESAPDRRPSRRMVGGVRG